MTSVFIFSTDKSFIMFRYINDTVVKASSVSTMNYFRELVNDGPVKFLTCVGTALSSALSTFFLPIWVTILAVCIIITVDMVLGIAVSIRNGEKPQSRKAWSTIKKFIWSIVAISCAHLVDTYISKQMDVLSFWAITLDKVILKSFVEKNEVKGHICFEGMGREFYRSNYCTFIWNHWYRRSFIEKNNIRFQPLIIGEDTLFNLHVYMANPSVVNVSSNLYRYVIHVDSATQVRKSNVIRKQIESYIVLLLELMKYCQLNKSKDFELSANLRKMVDQQCIPFMSRVLSSDYNNDEFKQLKSRLLLSEILPLSGNTKNERIINFLFKRPLTFVLFKQIYQKIFLPFVLPKLSKN